MAQYTACVAVVNGFVNHLIFHSFFAAGDRLFSMPMADACLAWWSYRQPGWDWSIWTFIFSYHLHQSVLTGFCIVIIPNKVPAIDLCMKHTVDSRANIFFLYSKEWSISPQVWGEIDQSLQALVDQWQHCYGVRLIDFWHFKKYARPYLQKNKLKTIKLSRIHCRVPTWQTSYVCYQFSVDICQVHSWQLSQIALYAYDYLMKCQTINLNIWS